MHPAIPTYLVFSFAGTTLLTLALLFPWLSGKPYRNSALLLMTLWLALQAALSANGVYYSHPEALPPRIVLFGIFPAAMVVFFLAFSKISAGFRDALTLQKLTWIHVVRIPVELVLYGLAAAKVIPDLMTFEGRNPDILIGITAIFMAVFHSRIGNTGHLIWNFLGLAFLINIVVHAVLSAPSPFQSLGLDQPNIAILYFPFSWLPAFIVPVVLLAHLLAIRKLLAVKTKQGISG